MSYRPRMPSNDALIETGRLPSGHPYARVGIGLAGRAVHPWAVVHRGCGQACLDPPLVEALAGADRAARPDVRRRRSPRRPPTRQHVGRHRRRLRRGHPRAVGERGRGHGHLHRWRLRPVAGEPASRARRPSRARLHRPSRASRSRRLSSAGRSTTSWPAAGVPASLRWHRGSFQSTRGSRARWPGCWVRTSPAGHRTCACSGSTLTSDDAHDATEALGGIRCPTLVVSGGRDLAYPPDLTRELVAGIPDVRHIDYPECRSRPRCPVPGGCLRVPRGDRRRASCPKVPDPPRRRSSSSAHAVAGTLGGEAVMRDGDQRHDRLVPGRPRRVEDRDPALSGVHGVGEDPVQSRVVRLGVDAGDAFERRLVHAEVQSEDARPAARGRTPDRARRS